MQLEPVADSPSLLIRGGRTWLCIADLHIGMETQLAAAGFKVPSQTPKMLASLEELACRADHLIILGDIKHRIPSVGRREDREIRPFVAALQKSFSSIIVVSGNHDGGIGDVLPSSLDSFSGRGTVVEDVGAFHGHVWPSEEVMGQRRIVMGHIHPSVLLTDSMGSSRNEKCWLRAGLKKRAVLDRYKSCPDEIVVVPAFNPLITGTPVNSQRGMMLGPLFKNHMVDRIRMTVYLLDGASLGTPPAAQQRGRGTRKNR